MSNIKLEIVKKYKYSLLVAFAIFFLSVRPKAPDVFYLEKYNRGIFHTANNSFNLLELRDWTGHFCFYFLLGGLLCYESAKNGRSSKSMEFLLIVVLLPMLYGGMIELVQEYLFPPRTGEWSDWIVDIMGASAAYMSWIWMEKKFKIVK